MELSDVGEHVFAAECIMMSRMNKVNNDGNWNFRGTGKMRTCGPVGKLRTTNMRTRCVFRFTLFSSDDGRTAKTTTKTASNDDKNENEDSKDDSERREDDKNDGEDDGERLRR